MLQRWIGVGVISGFGAAACAQTNWRELEAPLLTDHVQLTFGEDFVKAGEAYFSPDASWIIFQAVPQPPEGEEPSPHYSMYAAELVYEDGAIAGLHDPVLLSAPGSANTCGWFHPTDPGVVLFGTTVTPPAEEERPGFRVSGKKYQWAFPREMDIVRVEIPADGSLPEYERLIERDGYDAEGSWSPDAKHILYAHVNEEGDADIIVRDLQSGGDTELVVAPGYDGGPFFNHDGSMICYRSDRRGDDLLQLYVSELERSDDGSITGVRAEHALTNDQAVNWAPFFHPRGDAIVYTTSLVGHHNYEVFGIDAEPGAEPRTREIRRVTFADGFDGLSVFSPDGRWMMWTSQRNPDGEAGSGSSQVWVARVNGEASAFHSPLVREQAVALAQREAPAGAQLLRARQMRRNWVVAFRTDGGIVTYEVTPDSGVRELRGGT